MVYNVLDEGWDGRIVIHKSASHMNVSIEERSCGWLLIPKILSEIQLELTQFNPSKAAILHLKFARTLINERFEDISIEKIETFRTIHGETERSKNGHCGI